MSKICNSVHTGYQYFTKKKYLSANCNYANGNDDTSDLDILNGYWSSKHQLFKK